MTTSPKPDPRDDPAVDAGRLDAPGLPDEEGIELTDAEEQLAEEPEDKQSTDGSDGT